MALFSSTFLPPQTGIPPEGSVARDVMSKPAVCVSACTRPTANIPTTMRNFFIFCFLQLRACFLWRRKRSKQRRFFFPPTHAVGITGRDTGEEAIAKYLITKVKKRIGRRRRFLRPRGVS